MRIIRYGKEWPADVLYRRSQVGIIARDGWEELIVYDGDCQRKDQAVMRAIIDDVTFSLEGAIDSAKVALSRIEDCGLDDYEQEAAKEYLQEAIRRLDMAYDIVYFAQD